MQSEQQATPIAVLGAGSWGTALAVLLAENGYEVRLWSYDPEQVAQMRKIRCNAYYLPEITFPDNLEVFDDLPATLNQIQDILIVVPSHAFQGLLQRLKPELSVGSRLVWGTKGLDPQSGQLLHTIAQETLGIELPTAVLSGPSFAREVALKKPTAVTIATTDSAWAEALTARLNNSYFRVYTTSDIVGVEVCGAVKNILAIAAGVVDGLQLGINALSALVTRGLAEMQRLGIALGGKPQTFLGLAGVGDLMLTCADNQSRNRRFGAAIARGKTEDQAIAEIGQVVEGASNLKAVYRLAQQLQVEMPITEQIYEVLYQGLPVQAAIENLFSRQPRSELD
ncbi:MAG TPA: NAD(P)H-dependent glycerol-3-phosphate dehydrogenase [Gammaproteobacteria bacterium]|nr:NAD(P)H-dependent glycerol-3-phosphate dehydrogenase [Gammaproteobacteria bacterium]